MAESRETTDSDNGDTQICDQDMEFLPAIVDGTFFKIVSRGNDNKISAKCLLCTPKNKRICGTLKSTSNFVTHLKVGRKKYCNYIIFIFFHTHSYLLYFLYIS